MIEMKGCYWCKRRVGADKTSAYFNKGYCTGDDGLIAGLCWTSEELKTLQTYEDEEWYIGSACPHFEPILEVPIIFTFENQVLFEGKIFEGKL